jgi:ABC-2 type transport system permease protein
MSKTWLIIKREYITRVRNKTFLLSTFLLPLVMVLFIGGAAFISSKGASEKCIVALNDETSIFKNSLKNKKDGSVIFFNTDDTAVSKLLNGKFDAYIHIKDFKKNTENTISIQVKKQISNDN